MERKFKWCKVLTKSFLEEEYLNKEKSPYKISNMTSINPMTIVDYLRRYNIPIRKRGYISKWEKSGVDKEFLYHEYILKKKSASKIANKFNVGVDVILNLLRKYDINIRNSVESSRIAKQKNFSLNQEVIDYIDGLLLGDGYISSQAKYSGRYLQACTESRKGWVDKIIKDFEKWGIKSSISWLKGKKLFIKGKEAYFKPVYFIRTLSYNEFKWFRNRWYPNGKKIVPHDISFSPSVIGNWYLGDGTFSRNQIRLCTEGFLLEDTVWLSEWLNNNMNIYSRVSKRGGISFLRKKDRECFLDFISSFKIPCFEYKWNGERERLMPEAGTGLEDGWQHPRQALYL